MSVDEPLHLRKRAPMILPKVYLFVTPRNKSSLLHTSTGCTITNLKTPLVCRGYCFPSRNAKRPSDKRLRTFMYVDEANLQWVMRNLPAATTCEPKPSQAALHRRHGCLKMHPRPAVRMHLDEYRSLTKSSPSLAPARLLPSPGCRPPFLLHHR